MATKLKKYGSRPNLYISQYGMFWFVGDVNGERQRFSLETKNERDANQKLSETEATPKHKRVANRTIKCREAFELFIENGHGSKSRLAPTTKKLYEELWLLYALWRLGSMRVIDVRPAHIREVLDRAVRPTKEGGFGLSPTRHRNLYVALQSFFGKMTKDPFAFSPYDPVAHIGIENVPPKVESEAVGEKIVLTQEEIDRIAANFKKPPRPVTGRGGNARFKDSDWLAIRNRVMFLLLVETGLRIGEALALEWSDILYKSDRSLHAAGALPHVLLVTKQQSSEYRAKDPDSPRFAPLKGRLDSRKDKVRRVSISPFLARVLVEYIEYAEAGGHLVRGGLLFPNTVQRMSTSGHVGEAIKAAAEQAKLGRPIKTHYTRHTFITNLIEADAPDAKIEELTGDGIGVIDERYGHRKVDSKVYDEMKSYMRQ